MMRLTSLGRRVADKLNCTEDARDMVNKGDIIALRSQRGTATCDEEYK